MHERENDIKNETGVEERKIEKKCMMGERKLGRETWVEERKRERERERENHRDGKRGTGVRQR